MTQTAIAKPLPEPGDDDRPFWDGAMEGRLMLVKCAACGTVRLPWSKYCDECLSDELSWIQASGRGTLRTFAIMHQRYHPAFEPDLPYNVAIVELEEGPRMPTNIVNAANGELRVGMAVEVVFEPHDDVALPKFQPTR